MAKFLLGKSSSFCSLIDTVYFQNYSKNLYPHIYSTIKMILTKFVVLTCSGKTKNDVCKTLFQTTT